MRDLVIIGGGPAGLAAAAYAIRKRLDVLLISPDLGGKTNYRFALAGQDDYQVIRGKETVANFKRELEYLDFAHRRDLVKEIVFADGSFTTNTAGRCSEESRAVIVATGVNRVPLDVPGERKFLSRGLGYSAISYSHLFIDRTVFVTGNGPRVLRSARDLALQAAAVIINLEPDSDVPDSVVDRVAAIGNVTVIRDGNVQEFKGEQFAEEVVILHADGSTTTHKADGFFLEREPVPQSLEVAELCDLDGRSRIVVDSFGRTSRAGLFAAGDVTNAGQEQVLVALGDGARAALSAYDYLLSK